MRKKSLKFNFIVSIVLFVFGIYFIYKTFESIVYFNLYLFILYLLISILITSFFTKIMYYFKLVSLYTLKRDKIYNYLCENSNKKNKKELLSMANDIVLDKVSLKKIKLDNKEIKNIQKILNEY